jgi:PKD repeat protein
VYNTVGSFNVSLTVSDGVTNNTSTQTNYISTAGAIIPLTENFEGAIDPPIGWLNNDNTTQNVKWVKTNTASGFGIGGASMLFDNYSWNNVGEKDEIQMKRIDLSGYSNPKLYFDVAYMAYTGYVDSLNVLLSTNCGATFTKIYAKGGTGLSTAGSGTINFVPTAAQWRTDTINLSAYAGQQNVVIQFQNVNGYGNKLYVDNMNVKGSPIANFTATPTTVCANTNVQFTNTSTGSPTAYAWSFSGGTPSTSTLANPIINYATAGSYPVSLTASNAMGATTKTTTNYITVNVCLVTVNLKAFLEGYYVSTNTMTPALLNEGVGSNALLCDSVTVELHQATSPYALAYSYKGVIGTNGLLACTFAGSASGNAYYIVVKHRNSIETWSASPITISAVTSYDFSNDISKAYGSNQSAVGNGQYALFSGDINQDGYIDGSDYPDFDADTQNGVYGIYIATDLNGDGYVDGSDYPFFDANSQYGIYSITP